MQTRFPIGILLTALMLTLASSAPSQTATAPSTQPAITAPPDSFFLLVNTRNRDAARAFYKKYLSVDGLPVVAADVVADEALRITSYNVTHMLAGRKDIVAQMVKNGMYLIIMGKNQLYADMPEYRNIQNPAYMNERVRGTGGLPTSFGEENVLCLPIDRYDDESIGVHEFCHTIDATLATIDPTWRQRLQTTFHDAMKKGLWNDTYLTTNAAEFFAETSQMYFDADRPNNWNHGPIARREQLKAYDPETYELLRTTFNFTPETDWRYKWAQELPNIIPPPPEFKVDPYYTKFTYARELPEVGRLASDAAMLKANDTVRKLFAYRHDILKAIINDGVKLVVLGPGEKISDLPEYKALKDKTPVDALARYMFYTPEMKLLVVGQENVLADPNNIDVGANQIIRVCADAILKITANRPVVVNNQIRQDVQQYELRVKRLDVDFGKRLTALFDAAIAKNLWKGTPAFSDKSAYWCEGVLGYFDALGQDAAPNDALHPIATRELLKAYDPDLFALIDETFAYNGKVDWRFKP